MSLSNWFYQIIRGWVALLGLVIFLLFTTVVLPDQTARTEAYSAEAGSPDSSFVYSKADLYGFAEAYGSAGRAAYIRARFTFDVAWPLVYTFFLTTALTWIYAKIFPPFSAWRLANLAPVAGMAFDFLENLSTSLVMLRYPTPTAVVDSLAPFFTLVKWIIVSGSFVLILLGLAVGLWGWAGQKTK